MNSNLESKFGSVIYDRLNAVQMSASERQDAIKALRDADALVDGILWFTHKIEQLGAYLFLKPGIKH